MTWTIRKAPFETDDDVFSFSAPVVDDETPEGGTEEPSEWMVFPVEKDPYGSLDGEALIGYYYEAGTNSILQRRPVLDGYGGIPSVAVEAIGRNQYALEGLAEEPYY